MTEIKNTGYKTAIPHLSVNDVLVPNINVSHKHLPEIFQEKKSLNARSAE
jgi:hypothetical protein